MDIKNKIIELIREEIHRVISERINDMFVVGDMGFGIYKVKIGNRRKDLEKSSKDEYYDAKIIGRESQAFDYSVGEIVPVKRGTWFDKNREFEKEGKKIFGHIDSMADDEDYQVFI